MEILISKLLNYENKVFDEYCSKRSKLLDYISKIKTNKLNKQKLLVLINDVKCIIDPIKTSKENIEHFLNNKKFKKSESVDLNKMVFIYFFLLPFFSSTEESELTEETEISDSVSDSVSDSESLSLSE